MKTQIDGALIFDFDLKILYLPPPNITMNLKNELAEKFTSKNNFEKGRFFSIARDLKSVTKTP